MKDELRAWSVETFGHAKLGDERRLRRLIQMGVRAAERPDGRLSTVFGSAREREGAYDFVENRAIKEEALGKAIHGAAARSGSVHPLVFVPVDGTSINLSDRAGKKDFGSIGTYKSKATGLKVINALVLSPDGVPLGLGAQAWWKRPRKKVSKRHHMRLPVEAKETQHYLRALNQVSDAFKEHAPRTKPWFQIDRGGDAWALIRWLVDHKTLFTIRSAWDRRLAGEGKRYLRKTLRNAPVLYRYQIHVPGRTGHKEHPDRKARTATLAVRIENVSVQLKEKRTDRLHPTNLNAIHIREVRSVPSGEAPLDWILLTNAAASSEEEVQKVIYGFTQRWRIEDFHKSWKTGCCNVENTQLHTSAAVSRWATILAAVAVRVERLKHLSRSSPEEPASVELSKHEIAALRLLRTEYGPKNEKQPDHLSIATATRWIADLGGYTGKSSGGPPGSITIRRGLEWLQPAAKVLELLKRPPK